WNVQQRDRGSIEISNTFDRHDPVLMVVDDSRKRVCEFWPSTRKCSSSFVALFGSSPVYTAPFQPGSFPRSLRLRSKQHSRPFSFAFFVESDYHATIWCRKHSSVEFEF